MPIVVFGSTGSLGHLLLDDLTARGIEASAVTAGGRNEGVLAEYRGRGFNAQQADMSDAQRVAEVIGGNDVVVLISGNEPNRLAQHLSVVDAAKAAGVKHFYYTSGLRVDDPRMFVGADHKATEDAIIDSGMAFTILRNGWYIENYAPSLPAAEHAGTFAAAVGDAVVAAASRRDYAEALGAVMTADGHDNATYSLTGDTDFSYADIAKSMGEVLERKVDYTTVSGEQLTAILSSAGLDDATAGSLVALDLAIATGVLSKAGDDLSRLIGHPTSGLTEALAAAR